MNPILAYTIYPLVLIVSALAYLLGLKLSGFHIFALYCGVSLSAVIIFVAEKLYPLHPEWAPDKNDLLIDVFFYSLIVQVFYPFALYFIGVQILKNMGFESGVVFDIWPHEFSKITQFFILAISGEFFQYWWHRICHTYKFLWPIHAPHHFPKKLYSWNTSRFHFLDKFVEFFFTIFIFMAMGLSFEVLTYYYLFYAITGYIQHSNLDIKLGWMDYVIASGETHRFHHDSNLSKSKCNYANNFVVFDLIFKTFKRSPLEKNPVVGVRSKDVPKTVLEETKYPLTHLRSSLKDALFKLTLKIVMGLVSRKKVEKLKNAAKNPKHTQESRLFEIIATNKNTTFGADHHFSEIKTVDDFKRLVPIRDYEEHRPYIEMIFKGNETALSATSPHYFTKTSGTTGKPKYIPITLEIQKSYMDSQQILSHALYEKDPEYLSGDIFSVVGNECEEILFEKWPCGSMSGKLYSLAHKSVRAKHVFHKDMIGLKDSQKMYLYLATLALLSPNTTFYVSPNPSTLLKVFEVINTKRAEIIKLLETGSDPIVFSHYTKFDHAITLLKINRDLKISDVWPNLRIISMWMQGSCSYLVPKIKTQLTNTTKLSELGFLCSEFYGSLPLDGNTDKQIPTILDNFFEFIERNAYESGSRETLLVHELKPNTEYYIIVTTIGCFYRYFINDIIKVVGMHQNTPVIVFSQKGRGMTNITGEKLSEKQLINFFEEYNNREMRVNFFICLADQESQEYTLYFESGHTMDSDNLALELDLYLKQVNVEYAGKISSERLKPIKIYELNPGTFDLYKNHCIQKGQSEFQFKFLYLQYLKEVDFPFFRYIKK